MKKNTIYYLLLFTTCLFANDIIAQTNVFYQSSAIVLNQGSDINPYIKKLEAVEAEGKVYLKWIVNGEKDDCIFFVQKSTDGRNYNTIGYKKAIGTDINIDLLYCYTDESSVNSTVYYRIGRCYDYGRTLYSDYAVVSKPVIDEQTAIFFAKE